MLAGGAIGATAVNGLRAQGTAPAAYAVVDISAITNPDIFKTLGPKAGPAMAASGGKFIMRTDKITNLDGTPPSRFVVIAFDSVAKAQAWNDFRSSKGGKRHPPPVNEIAFLRRCGHGRISARNGVFELEPGLVSGRPGLSRRRGLFCLRPSPSSRH